MPVRVQTEDFDLTAEVAALRTRNPKIGAVACFVGTVRDLNDGSTVETMELVRRYGSVDVPDGLDDEVAAAVGCNGGHPMLRVDRLYSDVSGRPV